MGPLYLFAAAAAFLILIGAFMVVHTIEHPKRKTYAFALANGLPVDPSQWGLRFSERLFRFGDGSTTPGWVIDTGRANGPVMILSHGWNSSRYGALLRVPLLARFASRLVVYDMRGHGDSTAATSRLGATEENDLLEIIDQIDDCPVPVVLFGSSMGGGVAIAAAASRCDRVAAVIAEGPYRHFREPIAGQLRCRRLPAFLWSHLATACMALRLRGLNAFDRVALAKRVTCPLLVLHGTADPICPIGSARQIAAAACRGQLVEFLGAGHGDLVATDEPAYIRAIETFLDTVDLSVASAEPNVEPPRPHAASRWHKDTGVA